jgi:hypothetical protein
VPRTKHEENGSIITGPALKMVLPKTSENVVEFHFRRSAISRAYTLQFNSIDVIFAEILGVIATLAALLWVFFSHYTLWGSEQYILK